MPVILSRDYWYFALSVIFSFVGHFLQLPVRGKICFCKSQRGVGKLMMEGISSGLSSIGFGRFKWRRILIWLMLLLLNFVRLVLCFHRAWEEARRGRQSPLQGRARSELILSLVYGCKNVPAASKKKKKAMPGLFCAPWNLADTAGLLKAKFPPLGTLDCPWTWEFDGADKMSPAGPWQKPKSSRC